ncbi:MAG: LamG domain-containing protein [Roseateles sp.]|uniref:LamG domain-containing protein n=1 Tax=Roseateles sp. TaxID=1971397 RepID=UPI0040351212
MAAHRYWRAFGFEAYGSAGLDITEFQLLAGSTRVDATATLTSNIAPTAGSLANLKDGNTATGATWRAADLVSLVLSWDFGPGGDQDVTDIRIGSSADVAKFLLIARLQFSDDGSAWTDLATIAGIAWPGAQALTSSTPGALSLGSNVSLALSFDGANGSTNLIDASPRPKTFTPIGTAAISTAQSKWGGSSLLLPGSTGSRVVGPVSDEFDFGSGDLTIAAWVYLAGDSPADADGMRGAAIVDTWDTSASISGWIFGILGSASTTGTGLQLDSWNSGSGTLFRANVSISKSGWHHVEATVASGVRRLFLDGVLQSGSTTTVGTGYTQIESLGRPLLIGGTSNASYPIPVNGYIDDLLIVKGAALHTANFTPPTSAYLGGVLRNRVRGRAYAPPSVNVPSAASTPRVYGSALTAPPLKGRRDFVTGVLGDGIGRVKGTTKDKGSPNVPVSERVRLYRERDGLLVREMWSTPGTGAYSFDYVDEYQTYTVISYDHDKSFRAVVADGLSLEGGGVELIP